MSNNSFDLLNALTGFEPASDVKKAKKPAASVVVQDSASMKKQNDLANQIASLLNANAAVSSSPKKTLAEMQNAPKPAKPVSKLSLKKESKTEVKENSRKVENPIGLFAKPGSVTAQDFLKYISTFEYGADFAPSISQDSPFIREGIEYLKNLVADTLEPAVIESMTNHNRVRVLVDGYIGCHIGQPLGPQLYIARDLANATVNPDGGWTPALTASILKDYIQSRTEWVSKPDQTQKDIDDAVGRINASIGEDGFFYAKKKIGDKFGCAVELVNAIAYSCKLSAWNALNKSNIATIDPDVFLNIAVNLGGFTTSQAGLIVKTGFDSFEQGFSAQMSNDLKWRLASLGDCPEVKPEKGTRKFGAKFGDIIAMHGHVLPSGN